MALFGKLNDINKGDGMLVKVTDSGVLITPGSCRAQHANTSANY